MADYFTGYQNALPQTSLADMMNLASQAQQYKQAQTLNPLDVQARQQAIQQAQTMNPLLARQKELEVQQAQAMNPLTVEAQQLAVNQAKAVNPLDLQAKQLAIKQAQEINPLLVQAQKLAVEQAQALNPLERATKAEQLKQLLLTNPVLFKQLQAQAEQAQAEAKVSTETAGPRIEKAALEPAIARAQLSSAETAAQVASAVAPSTIATAANQALLSGTQAAAAQLNLISDNYRLGARQAIDLIDKKDLKYQDIVDKLTSFMQKNNAPEEAIAQAVASVPKTNDQKLLKASLRDFALKSLTSEQEISSRFPSSTLVNAGGKIVPTTTVNPALSGMQPGQASGAAIGTSLSPTVISDPITGQQRVIGGGGGQLPTGAVSSAAPAAGALPAAVGQPSAISAAGGGGAVRGGGQLTQLPNESPANFNARVAATQSAFSGAADQFNNPRSELGYLPGIQAINTNILKLLKDPKVDTGSVTDYLAGKTNLANLSAQQQELVKYLGQRVQNLTPRSDADTASKKAAYGALNMNKEALLNIVRQDNDWLEQQRLFSTGILKNGQNAQNPQNPNYGGVSNFTTNFTKFSADPQFATLMRYISLVGEGQTAKLDAGDKQEFNKLIGPMSADERKALEQKRQQLLQMVNGGQ